MSAINTRLLILSDTHADDWAPNLSSASADVVIHCGDLTDESKLAEFKTTINLLKSIDAPLKLVIPGNHDFTLDTPLFRRKIKASPSLEPELVKKEYGDYDEARGLFTSAESKQAGIVLLDEGHHRFTLANGALLTVYASPYTPSAHASEEGGGGGFQYCPATLNGSGSGGHKFDISPPVATSNPVPDATTPSATGALVDVAITHGPPHGLLDVIADTRRRGGCPELFAAVARARPRVHCFGHIHEGWGAKTVRWRDGDKDNDTSQVVQPPSHFTAIDNGRSSVVETLATLRRAWRGKELGERERVEGYREKGFCTARAGGLEDAGRREQTLFVNAAIQSLEEGDGPQLPWVVEMELPRAGAEEGREGKRSIVEGAGVSAGTGKRKSREDDDGGDAEMARLVKRMRRARVWCKFVY